MRQKAERNSFERHGTHNIYLLDSKFIINVDLLNVLKDFSGFISVELRTAQVSE